MLAEGIPAFDFDLKFKVRAPGIVDWHFYCFKYETYFLKEILQHNYS